MVGRTLTHYKIIELLGKGGMGEVWVAEDTKLGRRIALKVLPEALAADADRRGRFEREARAIAALNHPNIVTIHSVEEAEGVHFLTMELVDGQRLTDRIGERGLTLDQFFDIAIPLADAVHAAHQQGIMHRDLKPDNVMVSAEGRVKVLDFGLAKLREMPGLTGDDTAMATVTAEGRIVGTIAYMSPEQAEGKTVDERSDIFSLGILLYEMATGRRPFSGDTALSTMSAILKDDPVSVTELKQQLPRHLGRVISTCLEKTPERRYQSALDVRNELERLRKEVESGDTEVSQIASIQMSRRSRTPLAIGIVAAALVIGALVWAVFLRGDPGPQVAKAAAEQTLGVIGFENLSDPADSDRLGRMLMSLVTTDLAESGGIAVVSTAKVLAAYRETGGS
ncbi:MAG: serine/threonine-protein kinase, partial [Proteobacteria bacterium]|nr:serine/threonine-protein kinase [Pseudomonadota bacterium]